VLDKKEHMHVVVHAQCKRTKYVHELDDVFNTPPRSRSEFGSNSGQYGKCEIRTIKFEIEFVSLDEPRRASAHQLDLQAAAR